MIRIIEALASDWRRLDDRVEEVSNEIETLAHKDAPCKRLMTIPGIGPLISSATVATMGGGDMFTKGRDFGAWLGTVPKQISTGDRTILVKISKRGNKYLRALFVKAARCACNDNSRTAACHSLVLILMCRHPADSGFQLDQQSGLIRMTYSEIPINWGNIRLKLSH